LFKILQVRNIASSSQKPTKLKAIRVMMDLCSSVTSEAVYEEIGVFLDIEGAFDNTSFKAKITEARERGLEETCCRWIKSFLGVRFVHTSLMGSSLPDKVVGGCPQGRVHSPLL
jgi:hypothetical protein